ncbi:MAG: hypothetical protein R3E68_06250 [Burkholderiaceae bacterium]
MSIFGIDHVNLAVPSAQLETVVRFYTTVVGMTDGPRPDFPFPATGSTWTGSSAR